MSTVAWPSTRLKFAAEVNPRPQRPADDLLVTFVPMEAIGEWGGLDTTAERAAGEVKQGYTSFVEGDVIFAKITPCFENGKGAIARGLRGGIGFGTTELHVLRARSGSDERFLLYLTQSALFMKLGEAAMYGAGGQKRVPPEFVQDFALCIPPRSTQRAIADFLDKKTAAIDALIAKKERLVELLQEKRQALITQAVTKGLDPTVPMKESGVEWLGEIPAHWRVLPIKRLARRGAKTFTDGDWIEAPYITDEGVRLLQTGNVGVGVFKEQGFRYVSEETFQTLRCTPVQPGDVMICRLDGPVGRACIAPELGCKVITSVDNAILKTSSEHDPRYVVYCLSLPRYLSWVQVLCRVGGGFRFRVSRSMLGEFRMPAPSRSEQERIADQLDGATEASVRVERTLKASAERLREYRQALITEAVTGKLNIAQEADRDPDVVVGQALEAAP